MQIFTAYYRGIIETLAAFVILYGITGCVLEISALNLLYKKADLPGKAAFIPFYNKFTLYKMLYGNGWLFLIEPVLLCIAFLQPKNLAMQFLQFIGSGMLMMLGIWNCQKTITCFGKKSPRYFVGMILCPPAVLTILAVGGDTHYQGVPKDGTSYEELRKYFKERIFKDEKNR